MLIKSLPSLCIFTRWKNIPMYYLINMSLNNSPIFIWINVAASCSSCAPRKRSAAGKQEALLRCCQKQYAINMQAHTHSSTQTWTIEMHTSIHLVKKHRHVWKSEWRSALAAGERSVEDVWSFFSAADTFVDPATSAIYAAYQKLAARIFNVSTRTRCTQSFPFWNFM